jgi:hypothetical protein
MSKRADQQIAGYLNEHGYHPRSSKHGDALCGFLLTDLVRECPPFHLAATQGKIVYDCNYTIDRGSQDQWNVDLVLGPPSIPPLNKGMTRGLLSRGTPREIWIAVDAKTIMTEHGKARRNRQRDLNSFQDILHRKNAQTIVAGLLLVNMAPKFKTPLLRKSEGPNVHKNIERLVAEIVEMMKGLNRSGPEPSVRSGIEALGVIVVSHTNVPGETSFLVTSSPAPSEGQRLHYGTFLRELCEAFKARFT